MNNVRMDSCWDRSVSEDDFDSFFISKETIKSCQEVFDMKMREKQRKREIMSAIQ